MPQQDFNYEEVGLDFLVEKTGKEFYEKVNSLILKSYEKENIYNLESVNVGILYLKNADTFQVWNSDTKEFIMQIDKNFTGGYFCKPAQLLRAVTRQIFFEAEGEHVDLGVLDELLKFHNLNNHFQLNDYLFHLSVVAVDYLGLDIQKSKVVFFDFDGLILDGEKKEFVNTDLDTTDMKYMLNFYSNKDYFKIMKISGAGHTVDKVVNLYNFYMAL